MGVLKVPRLLQAGLVFGLFVLFDLLEHLDPSRWIMHLVGSGVVIAILPFVKWRRARLFQVIALGWLLADLIFRNGIALIPVVRTDASAWRLVLAVAYATMIALLALYDRATGNSPAGLFRGDRTA